MTQSPPVTERSPGRVRTDRRGRCLWLTIDRADSRNAFTVGMLDELAAGVRSVEPADRAVVITGAGGQAFSAGADLGSLTGPAQVASVRAVMREAFETVSACEVTTIARIDGACIGAGLELALRCDLRLCSANSTFRLPAARLGIDYPEDGLRHYLNVLGHADALRVVLLGERLTAREAQSMGLVHLTCEDVQDLDGRLDGWTDLLTANDPAAVRGMKRTLVRFAADRCAQERPTETGRARP